MEESLISWIKKISEKRNDLGGFSICPFAKKALEENKIFWSYIAYEPISYISRYMETMNDKDYEIVVFYNLSKNLSNEECLHIVHKLNSKFSNLIFLKDHPDDPGYINDIYTGNGEYPIILAQPRVKLEEAREKLSKTKYYDYWSEEYKNEIFNYGKK
mgnify:FL=1